MGDPTSRRRAYKLKDPITRDTFQTWDLNHRSFCRQDPEWRKFLPGQTRKTWVAYDVDDTRGINVYHPAVGANPPVLDEDETDKVRASLEDFLVTLGTYAPEHFMWTVVHESTSYEWVMDKIRLTFKLDTRGINFLSGPDLKLDFGTDGITHQQGFQAIKEFYCSTLLKKGEKFRGTVLDKDEALGPLGENILVEKWLHAIDPRLRSHILQTRGSLFTEDRPTLAENQKQLSDQMDTILQELDGDGTGSGPSIARMGFGRRQVQAPARGGGRGAGGGFQTFPRGGFQTFSRGAGMGRGAIRPSRGGCPSDTCLRCFEAGRVGPATKTHFASQCIYPQVPRMQQGAPPMRVLLIPSAGSGPAQVQEIQLSGNMLQQVQQVGYEGQEEEQVDFQEGGEQEQYGDGGDFYLNKDYTSYSSLTDDDGNDDDHASTKPPNIALIPTRRIQKFSFLYHGKQVVLAVDSGAEGDCITEKEARRLGILILQLEAGDRIPQQADGSPLDIVGAAKATFVRDGITVHFHGYVVKELAHPILCSLPFIERNGITQHPDRRTMVIGGRSVLEDPPVLPGANLPFSIQAVNQKNPDSIDNRIGKIEIGKQVPKKIKERLHKVHSYHAGVFDGKLSGGYNGQSGDYDVSFEWINGVPPPPHRGTVPTYQSRLEDRQVMQAKLDDLEKEGIVIKAADVGINIRYTSPSMLARKISSRNMAKEDYEKLLPEDKAKLNRFVLCLNKMCDYVMKKPFPITKAEDTVNLVGSWKYVITGDLQDSFNQRRIQDHLLPYFGFHGPFGENYIFTRSPQGLVNQSEELEMLVKAVLKEGIRKGHVKVHADNIYVGGDTMEEAVDRWEKVLEDLNRNNLKLTPKKTACFPERLDLLGWTKEGSYLVPDPHRQNALITASLPRTIKDLRSFLGTYHTFFKCMQKQNLILAPLTKMISDSPPPGKVISWTEEQVQAFENAKDKAKVMDRLYIPTVEDQLAFTSDYAEKGTENDGGISATLWAHVDEEFRAVARMSAPLQPQQEHLDPCDGEATAVFVASKCPAFRGPILAAKPRTLAMVDSKPLVEAANLIRQGKFSASRLINNVHTAISELNLDFHHISGKMGRNFADDYASRNPVKCQNPATCQIHSFVAECASLNISTITLVASPTAGAIIGAVGAGAQGSVLKDIISGKTRLPLHNMRAMAFLQAQDKHLRRARDLLTAGQRPSDKRDGRIVKYLFRSDVKTSINREGCMVVTKREKGGISTKELVVVPDNMAMGLIFSLHINLGHPTKDQLQQALATRFFVMDIAKRCEQVVTSCTLCESVKVIPKEVHSFKPNIVPDHPGRYWTVDIMKECSKAVMVAADNFSGHISTSFINGEKEEDLMEGILKTVIPFKSAPIGKIRTDNAPGFVRLARNMGILGDLGLEMELGDVKNKNSLAVVDKKMNELREAIRKVASSPDILDQKVLTKATVIVNDKIRHHKMTSKEIMFSRDAVSGENLKLEDEEIAEKIMNHREKENPASARAKSLTKQVAKPADAKTGQLVFIKDDSDKTRRRDLYMVIDTNKESDTATVIKIRDALSNKLASIAPHDARYRYNVKQESIILAPNQPEDPVKHDVHEVIHPHLEAIHPHPEAIHPQYPTSPHLPHARHSPRQAGGGRRSRGEDTDEEEEEHDIVFFESIGSREGERQPRAADVGDDLPDGAEAEDGNEAHPADPGGRTAGARHGGPPFPRDGGEDNYAHRVGDGYPPGDGRTVRARHGGPPFPRDGDGGEDNYARRAGEDRPTAQDDDDGDSLAEDVDHQDEVHQDVAEDDEEQGAVADGGEQNLMEDGQVEDHQQDPGLPNQVQVELNQPRQPKNNDVIAYWDGQGWTEVTITNKVQGYKFYYNCASRDGREFGVTLKPATARRSYLWTLLDEHPEHPEDQDHREDQDHSPLEVPRPEPHPPSREVSPVVSQHRHEVYGASNTTLDLSLSPYQVMEPGRVHMVPGVPAADAEYSQAVMKRANKLLLPPEQEHMRMGIARTLAEGDMMNKSNSLTEKIKKSLGVRR